MNTRFIVVALTLAAAATLALGQTTPPTTAPAAGASLKSEKERMGYALGLEIGDRFKGLEIDRAALSAGINDAMDDKKPLLTDKEIEAAMTALQQQALDAKNRAGSNYMADNAKKDGVKTTASGLQYKVIKSGAGKTPKGADTVSVNYRGTLITGQEFDASRGSPVSFPVNGVIAGWTEALQLMKEGDKWQLTVPAKLAYGSNPPPGAPFGPNEVLIFEIELLKVEAGR